MIVHVEFLAQLREAAGVARTRVELTEPAKLSDLVAHLTREGNGVSELLVDDRGALLPSILVAVDGVQVRATLTCELHDRATVVLGTPIAGG